MTRTKEGGYNFGKMSKTPKKPVPDSVEIKADDALSNLETKSKKDSNEGKTASLLSTPRMEHIVVRRPQRNRDSIVIEDTEKYVDDHRKTKFNLWPSFIGNLMNFRSQSISPKEYGRDISQKYATADRHVTYHEAE